MNEQFADQESIQKLLMDSYSAKEAVEMPQSLINEVNPLVEDIKFQEPSDEELISFIQGIPLKQDYKLLETTNYIFPWSVNEVWANVFEFDAPYSFDIAMSELGEVFLSDEEW